MCRQLPASQKYCRAQNKLMIVGIIKAVKGIFKLRKCIFNCTVISYIRHVKDVREKSIMGMNNSTGSFAKI
jgi:hypothetical protein